jgi:protein-disulfide isomerase
MPSAPLPPELFDRRINRVLPLGAVIITALAAAISVDLTLIHYWVHVDPSFSSFCAISETINCNTVALSNYSVIWRVPISVWGMGTYLLLTLIGATGFLRRLPTSWPWGLLFLAACGSVAFAAYLAYVSHVLIGAYCILCMALYFLNLALLTVTAFALVTLRQSVWKTIVENVQFVQRHQRSAIGLALLVGALAIVTIAFYPRWYLSDERSRPDAQLGSERLSYGEYLSCPKECPAQGALEPKVTIIEYSDYECPHCQRSHVALLRALAKYGQVIKVVHRQFPLDHLCNPVVRQPFHRQSCAAARAAMCATEQGHFIEFSELMWARSGGDSDDERRTLALQAGLNVGEFDECLDSPRPTDAVMRDINSGMRLKIRGTPAFLINGRLLVGALSEQSLDQIIAVELKQTSGWNKER